MAQFRRGLNARRIGLSAKAMAAKKKTTSTKKKPLTKKSAAKKPSPKKAPAKKSAATKKSGPKKAAPKKVSAKRPMRTSKRPPTQRKSAAKKPKFVKPKVELHEAPEALALARSIAGVAAEKKAENVVVIDTRSRSEAVGYDYLVLASGESDRQLSAIHEGVEALLKPQGKRASSVEASPDWVLVTYDEGVLAHFFTPDKRDNVDLETLWGDAPRVAL
jgi:ribosome-associated protein